MDKTENTIQITASAIQEELERVLRSSVFSQSERLSRFLRFAVERALAKECEALKEYVIGTEVYDRRPSYDTSQDSIVRSEARRLRGKLKQYYEGEGRADPVFIYFRPGSYVPVFRQQNASTSATDPQPLTSPDVLVEGRGVSLAVLPFKDLSETATASACASAITDELLHDMMRAEGVRVVAVSPTLLNDHYGSDLSALARELGVGFFLKGFVRQEGERLRVTLQSARADGFQLWAQHFEIQPGPGEIFTVAEHIARALSERFRSKSSLVRRMKASLGSTIVENLPNLFRSEALLDEGTPDEVEVQIARFERIAQDVPGYPDPLFDIAACSYELALRGAPVSAEDISQAKTKAQEASAIDPEMTDAMGYTAGLLAFEWKWKESEETFKKALRLGAQASTYRASAVLFSAKGHFDEARYYLQRADDLDPFSYRQKTAWIRFFNLSRNYAELDRHVCRSVLFGPMPLETRLHLGLGYCALGRRVEAIKIAEENRRYAGSHPTIAALLAEISGHCGATAVTHKSIEQFRLFSANAGISRFRQTLLAIAIDDTERAFALLTTAVAERDPEMIWLCTEPRLDRLRRDPRFAELTAQVMHNN